jgi:hypothetical protein
MSFGGTAGYQPALRALRLHESCDNSTNITFESEPVEAGELQSSQDLQCDFPATGEMGDSIEPNQSWLPQTHICHVWMAVHFGNLRKGTKLTIIPLIYTFSPRAKNLSKFDQI